MDEPAAEPARRPPGRRPLAEGSAEDTRRQIRKEALRLFNERGYASVSIDDIVEAARVTRATLYYHYRGKAEIFVQCVLTTLEWVREQILAVTQLPDMTARERLRLIVTRRREASGPEASGNAPVEDMSETMLEEALPHLSPRHREQVVNGLRQLHQPIHDLLQEGITRGEFRQVPPAALNFAFWQVFNPPAYPADLDRKALEDALLTLFWR